MRCPAVFSPPAMEAVQVGQKVQTAESGIFVWGTLLCCLEPMGLQATNRITYKIGLITQRAHLFRACQTEGTE